MRPYLKKEKEKEEEKEEAKEKEEEKRSGHLLCQAEGTASSLRRASTGSWGPPCEQKAH